MYFDNILYFNESKDDLWFYVGFIFVGLYVYDLVDNDIYMLLINGNYVILWKVWLLKYFILFWGF